MKLSEALSLRADLQNHVSQLKARIKDSARVPEGDTPAEDVASLFSELDECLVRLRELIYRINATNMLPQADGENITAKIAAKDVLSLRVSVLSDIIRHMTDNDPRFLRGEVRYVRTADLADLRKEADRYSRDLRKLDLEIQRLNWSTDLI